jgi:hypothetical protein
MYWFAMWNSKSETENNCRDFDMQLSDGLGEEY